MVVVDETDMDDLIRLVDVVDTCMHMGKDNQNAAHMDE